MKPRRPKPLPRRRVVPLTLEARRAARHEARSSWVSAVLALLTGRSPLR